MFNLIKEIKSIDLYFLSGAILLLILIIIIPEIPLLDNLLNINSGLRLAILVFEIVFSSFVILFDSQTNGSLQPNSKALMWLTALWLVWSSVSALVSPHVATALFRVVGILVNVVFLYAAWLFFRRYRELSLLVRNVIVLGFIIYSIFLLVGWALSGAWVTTFHSERLFVGFGNIRHFGFYALIALVVSLGLLWWSLNNKRPILSFVYFLCSIASWTWMFVIGGRGPFFALIIATAVTAYVNKGYFNKRFVLAVVWGLLVGFMLSIPASPEQYGPFSLFDSFAKSETINEFSSSRLSIWKDSFKLVMQHPFFGIGPDGYLFELTYKYPETIHPHGIFPQIALEWGLPGALLFLMLAFAVIVNTSIKVSRLVGDKRDYVGIYWVVMSIAVFSTVDGILYHPRPVLLFLVLLALLFGQIDNQNKHLGVRNFRRVAFAILFVSIIISVLHTNALISVASGPVSHIDDRRVNNIRLFPSVMADPAVVGTLANWGRLLSSDDSAEDLLDWYSWAEKNSIQPWIFAYLHAELLFENNRYDEAIALLRHYREISPGYFQDKFGCLQARYIDAVVTE